MSAWSFHFSGIEDAGTGSDKSGKSSVSVTAENILFLVLECRVMFATIKPNRVRGISVG